MDLCTDTVPPDFFSFCFSHICAPSNSATLGTLPSLSMRLTLIRPGSRITYSQIGAPELLWAINTLGTVYVGTHGCFLPLFVRKFKI